MKKIMVAIAVLASLNSIAQNSESAPKKMKYGFCMGTNYSILKSPESIDLSVGEIRNGFGGYLGVMGEYTLHKNIALQPKMGLSFNSGEVYLVNLNDNPTTYAPLATSVDFSGNLILQQADRKIGVYGLIGSTFQYALPHKTSYSNLPPSSNNLTLDIGLGMNRAFSEFIISPELKYSFGLSNVNKNPVLQTLYYHSISLVFGFKS